jgi:hypothetical protein
MITRTTKYTVNKREITLDISADRIVRGKDSVLYRDDNNIINNEWEKEGFVITPFLTPALFNDFYDFVHMFTVSTLKKIKSFDSGSFTLEKYHKFVTDEEHLKFLKYVAAGQLGISGIPLNKLPFSYTEFDKHVSNICNANYTCKKTYYKFFTFNRFCLRFVRPLSKDNNPPHRDCHLKRNRKIVNIYAPIAGSNNNSSLPIIPGSHFWPDIDLEITKGKTYVNGVKFTNPAIISAHKGLDMVTPDPKLGEIMVFTPYAIHGGGKNFNSDLTRISLEMRFQLSDV